MTKITREFLKAHHACYHESKVNTLVPPDGLTALEVAELPIPEEDRIWVLTRKGVLADNVLWAWAARTAERALGRIPKTDPRSLAVIPLLRRLAKGEIVDKEEIKRIRRDADAVTYYAADAAAADAVTYYAAADAYYVNAAFAAATDAAADAVAQKVEREKQIADIIQLLSSNKTNSTKGAHDDHAETTQEN